VAAGSASHVQNLKQVHELVFYHFRFSIKKPAKLSQGGHKKSLSLFSENQAVKKPIEVK
jgi:hypothetical protein